ncbi:MULTISPECIES: hypothetical protein [Novosphingobium]|uniref:hypothetical protein n=1 Tax=Novosphingobium TaxID=165696 RepID=UPI001CD278FA|nr:hypothetical protein [Novosphingobium percolationis]MCH7628353.1 hypothetical protein [Pseudomonadota bacterium]
MTGMEVFAFCALVLLLICAMGMGLDAYKRRMDLREKELELLAARTAEKAAQYAAGAERLEQRVRVLERIATDRAASLADEIGRAVEQNPALAGQIEALREARAS